LNRPHQGAIKLWIHSSSFISYRFPSLNALKTGRHGTDGQRPGRRPSSPPCPINSTREPLRLSLCTLPHSYTLLLAPTSAAAPEICRRAIASHPALPVVGEHPSASPHLCLPHVSPTRRPGAPEPFFSTPPPDRATRSSSSLKRHRFDLRHHRFPIAQAVSNSSRRGEQTFPRHLFTLPRAVALPTARQPRTVRHGRRGTTAVDRATLLSPWVALPPS
jgi:hypothetical protein